MCPRIWIFDSYSLFIALGIIAAILLFEYYGHAQKVKRLTRSITEVLAVAAALFGFLGAWLFQNLYDYIASPATFSFSSKMTFFGGLLTGCAFFFPLYFLFIKRKDEAGFKAIFPIAPACISLCHAFGRIGCFMAGCCYGKETNSWIGIVFPGMEQKVIPTNLLEAVFLFLLTAILILLAFKAKGLYPLIGYCLGYGAWRFAIEFFRDDPRGEFVPGLSPSQFWAIVLFAVGLVLLSIELINRHNRSRATCPQRK